MEQNAEVCIICGRDQQTGILICDQLICEQCEQEMIRTDVKEEKYHFFVDQMKKIWYKMTS
ncbi:carnitine-CoA ligase [Insulibacter thermoxylanivorax]|uniref:Carnitine-CoA ligase n=1 Tax=Insulibacter thermoxylanivorax TaxID=2749268 RepID=A0A916QFB3_9BACL|nr:sigma factor G inhibitor Gin [Insulibacter thermoxylanivorax]GFR38383.1 carnitine-CoA ligase [Insulibacter thermoxylanivorax]